MGLFQPAHSTCHSRRAQINLRIQAASLWAALHACADLCSRLFEPRCHLCACAVLRGCLFGLHSYLCARMIICVPCDHLCTRAAISQGCAAVYVLAWLSL